jgi:hypothetical protein
MKNEIKYEISHNGLLMVEGRNENGACQFANIQDIENLQEAIKDSQTRLNNKKIRDIQESKNDTKIKGVDEISFKNGMKIISNLNGLFIVLENGLIIEAFLKEEYKIGTEKDGRVSVTEPSNFFGEDPKFTTYTTIHDFWKTLI